LLAREEWVARRTIPIKCSKPPENTLLISTCNVR